MIFTAFLGDTRGYAPIRTRGDRQKKDSIRE